MANDSILTAMLAQTGLLTPEQARDLAAADREGDPGLVASVVRLGFAEEEDFLRRAAEALGIEYVDVSERDPLM